MTTANSSALVVVGESMGGVIASVRAAREGLDVLLVTYKNGLGGIFPSLGAIETHYSGVKSPLLQELRERIRRYYLDTFGKESEQYQTCVNLDPDNPMMTFEPHVASRIITQMVEAESRIKVLKCCYPVSVELARDMIKAVTVQFYDHDEQRRIEGETFIDATYEGDLAAVVGVPYRIGREPRSAYNEPHAGRIFTRWVQGRFPVDADQGRLNIMPKWTTMGLMNGSTGEGDDNIQDYNFRLCLSCDPANRRLPEKPEGYDRTDYLAIVQTPQEIGTKPYALQHRFLNNTLRDMLAQDHLFHGHALPNNKRSWNATNFPGASKTYPDADWETRHRVTRNHVNHALGILYFMQNDETMPDDIKAMAREWGLAKDEFVDNENIPQYMYIREGRRIVGRYTYNENDGIMGPGLRRAPINPDSIAITEFPLDSLPCSPERMPGSLCDGQMFLMEISRPGQIPFPVLLPERIQNLMVPVCASVSHVAWGTVRQTPTLMHLSEAAGYAAVLAHHHGTEPGRLETELLQQHLVENGVMVSFFNDFDMTSDRPWVAAVQYLGTKGFFKSYDARPDAPLTQVTVGEWARTTALLLAGDSFNPSERARHLPDDEVDRREAAITVSELTTALSHRAEAISFEQIMTANGFRPDQHLTRGEGCMFIYALLRVTKA